MKNFDELRPLQDFLKEGFYKRYEEKGFAELTIDEIEEMIGMFSSYVREVAAGEKEYIGPIRSCDEVDEAIRFSPTDMELHDMRIGLRSYSKELADFICGEDNGFWNRNRYPSDPFKPPHDLDIFVCCVLELFKDELKLYSLITDGYYE